MVRWCHGSCCCPLPPAPSIDGICLLLLRLMLLLLPSALCLLLLRLMVRWCYGTDGVLLLRLLDIRDRRQYERAHVRGSAHVPLYIENEDNDIGTIIKRQAHNNFAGLFYGLSFTKPNQDFTKMERSKFSPDSKLLVVCQEGLRSTAAADALEREGFQNLACITSGLQTLKPEPTR